MSKVMTQNAPPEGWEEIDIQQIWQVGMIFRWSPVFKGWLRDTNEYNLSIHPGETVGEAYYRQNEVPMPYDTFAFAPKE